MHDMFFIAEYHENREFFCKIINNGLKDKERNSPFKIVSSFLTDIFLIMKIARSVEN